MGAGSSFSPPQQRLAWGLRGTDRLHPVTLHAPFPSLEVPCTPFTNREAKECDQGQAGPRVHSQHPSGTR